MPQTGWTKPHDAVMYKKLTSQWNNIEEKVTYAVGETSFNGDEVGSEIYVRRDTRVAHGPFQNVYDLSVSDTSDFWAGIGHAYAIDTPLERVDVQLHAMTGLYSRGTGVDLGGPIEFRSGIELA